MGTAHVFPTCTTGPGAKASTHDAGQGTVEILSPAPVYALEELLLRTSAGARLASLYRQHSAEVVKIFIDHPEVQAQARQLLRTFLPGLTALSAGRGETQPIWPEMVEQVRVFWTSLSQYSSPALRQTLEQERQRLGDFKVFNNSNFREWAGLLGVSIPGEPFLRISRTARDGERFLLLLNDVPGIEPKLWRTSNLRDWIQVPNATVERDGTSMVFVDPTPPVEGAYYRVGE